jgi:hypothetical protein
VLRKIFKEVGLSVGGLLVIESVPLKGILRTCPVFLFYTCGQEIKTSFAMHSHHDELPHHKSKSNGANQPYTEISKAMSQNKPFLILN